MNPFPVVFARERHTAELEQIRQSYSTKSGNPFLRRRDLVAVCSCTLRGPKTSLRRRQSACDMSLLSVPAFPCFPASARLVCLRAESQGRVSQYQDGAHNFSCLKATDLSQPISETSQTPTRGKLFISVRSVSAASPAKVSRRVKRQLRAAAALPVVLGREIGRERRAESSPGEREDVILNLETGPGGSPKTLAAARRRVERSKSVQGSGRESLTRRKCVDISVRNQGVDTGSSISHGGTPLPQRSERAGLDLEEGNAALPARLARLHYFERAFGAPLQSAEKSAALLHFLATGLRVQVPPGASIRCSSQSESGEVSMIVLGPQSPVSRCCKSAVVFLFSKSTGGKVLCTASCCASRTVANFLIGSDLRDKLWTGGEMHQASMSSSELSSHVRKGSYKTVSLRREMRRRGLSDLPAKKLERKGLFTNEKLRHVSPVDRVRIPPTRLPIFQQLTAVSPRLLSNVGGSPLQSLLQRGNSRHNAVHSHQTPAELIEQLSSLLQPL